MLLLLQLHLFQLLQQLLWSLGLLIVLDLRIVCSWRLLYRRRLHWSILGLGLLIGSIIRCFLITFLLGLRLRLRLLRWLLRLTGNRRSTASSRRKDHALHGGRAVRASQDHVVKPGSTENAGQHVAFGRRAKINCNAL